MISITYEDFIKGINNRSGIKQIDFYIEGYSHYHSCSIGRYIDKVKVYSDIRVLNGRITCILANDHSEDVYFYGTFDEKRKLFNLGKQGTFTLKQVWDRVVITNVTYF